MADNNNSSTPDFTAVVSLLRQAESILSTRTVSPSSDDRSESANPSGSTNSTTTHSTPVADRALSNFRQLFGSYSGNRSAPLPSASLGQARPRATAAPATKRSRKSNPRSFVVKETWTHDFFCLADSVKHQQPSRQEKLALQNAGLGRRTIVFGRSDDPLTFVEKIEAVYPKIKNGGGFELLRSGATNKELVVITPPPCGYSVPFLRDSSGLVQALAYIRPLQRSLDVSPTGTLFQVLN